MKITVYSKKGKMVFNQVKNFKHEWKDNKKHYIIIENEETIFKIPYSMIKGYSKEEKDF